MIKFSIGHNPLEYHYRCADCSSIMHEKVVVKCRSCGSTNIVKEVCNDYDGRW